MSGKTEKSILNYIKPQEISKNFINLSIMYNEYNISSWHWKSFSFVNKRNTKMLFGIYK